MATSQQQQQEHELDQQQISSSSSSFLLDELYCEEERFEDDDEEGEEVIQVEEDDKIKYPSLFPLVLLEQDLFWEDEELVSLFTKEQEQQEKTLFETDSCLVFARSEAIQWLLKVIAHYGFTTLTAVLSINYLDRFLNSLHFQRDNPWMIQLLAVTCLSLAAKVEETQVPLLLDLQVEDSKYVFEAKTIQRMELLVLSTLKWKMHPVTPLSFLDHIIRRLGLKSNLHWDFLKKCERLLLTLVSDSRFVSYLPSVLATAAMMNIINQVEPLNSLEYQNQLLGALKINKEKVHDCYKLILEVVSNARTKVCYNPHKRKYGLMSSSSIPSSPNGVIDAVFGCDDSSNDSWILDDDGGDGSSAAEVVFKRSRRGGRGGAQEQQMPLVFVDVLGSP